MLKRGSDEAVAFRGAGSDAAFAGARTVEPLMDFGQSVALIPQSGIQFLDFEFSDTVLSALRRRFLEEEAAPEADYQPVLHSIVMEDGMLRHPISNDLLASDETLAISGHQAVAPFLDRWVPIPIMRIVGADNTGKRRFEEGPANWVRVFVSRAADDDGADIAASDKYRVVVAIDTAIDARNGGDDDAYLAPRPVDVSLGSKFGFSDDTDDVAWFVGEPWVDSWIESAYLQSSGSEPKSPTRRRKVSDGLQHLAHYLTFLTVLGELCALPDIRFLDASTHKGASEPVDVDLVLDIGNSRAFGVLLEDQNQAGSLELEQAEVLALRNLSDPGDIHARAFASRTEFAAPPFGDQALSRQSGRTNAFFWPSFARVGSEALYQSAMPGGASGRTGVSSPKRYLWDNQPRDEGWCYSSTSSETDKCSQGLSGRLLRYISQDGNVLDPSSSEGGSPSPAVRTVFSRSSLLSFFVAEVIVQAISQINSVFSRARKPRANAPRQLRRIVVTLPIGLPSEDYQRFRQRMEGAVELVWQGFGWQDHEAVKAPPRPTIEFGIDEAMGPQMVYVYDQLTRKFGGPVQDYLSLKGKSRAETGVQPALRIASVDMGGGATGLSIATYTADGEKSVRVSQQLRVGMHVGGDDVLEAVVVRHVVPAIEAALKASGHDKAKTFMHGLLYDRKSSQSAQADATRRRLVVQLAAPTALALIQDYEKRGQQGGDGLIQTTIGALLADHYTADEGTGGDGPYDAAARFDELMAGEGLSEFCLIDAPVAYRYSELSATIRAVLGSVLADLSDIACALDCDVCLVSGRPSHIPDVMELLLERMPVRADRIVLMHDYRPGKWYPLLDSSGSIADAKTTVALGTLINELAGDRLNGIVMRGARDGVDRAGGDDTITRMQRYIGRIDRDGTITPVPGMMAQSEALQGTVAEANGAGVASGQNGFGASVGQLGRFCYGIGAVQADGSYGRLVVLDLNEGSLFGGAPPSLVGAANSIPAVLEKTSLAAIPVELNSSIEAAGVSRANGGLADVLRGDEPQRAPSVESNDGHWLDTGMLGANWMIEYTI